MGGASAVHNEIGGGLLEEVYQQSFEIELGLREIPFVAKQAIDIYYKGTKLKKTYIPDLLVFERIAVELKSVSELTKEHEAQLLNYMRLSRLPIGYLINFAPLEEVEWKRFLISEFSKETEIGEI